MEGTHNHLMAVIYNWVFGIIATTSFWVSINIDVINKWMEFGLKAVSFLSFAMLVIMNFRKTIRELKKIFNNCPDE